jgi:hypothetical protein
MGEWTYSSKHNLPLIKQKKNSVTLVSKRTIPTERLSLVGEVSATSYWICKYFLQSKMQDLGSFLRVYHSSNLEFGRSR